MSKERLIVHGAVLGQRLLKHEQFLMYLAKEKKYVRPFYGEDPRTSDFIAFIYPEGYELMGIVGTIFAVGRKDGGIVYHVAAVNRAHKKYITRIYRDISKHRVMCVLREVSNELLERIEKEPQRESTKKDGDSIWH